MFQCYYWLLDGHQTEEGQGSWLLATHPPIFKQFPKLSVANLTSKCPLIYWSHWWSWVNSKFTDTSAVLSQQGRFVLRLQINGRARICRETITKAASWQLYKAVSSARFTATLGWAQTRKFGQKWFTSINEDVMGLILWSLTTLSPPTSGSEMNYGHYQEVETKMWLNIQTAKQQPTQCSAG